MEAVRVRNATESFHAAFDLALVLEKNQILRMGLIKVLSESGCKTCFGFGGIDEIKTGDIEPTNNVLILVDPGDDEQKVINCVASLSNQLPNSRIVVFSDSYSDAHIAAALEGGAVAYLLTSISCEELVKSIEVIALGGHIVPHQALKHFVSYFKKPCANGKPNPRPQVNNLSIFSSRELEIMRGLSQGMSNKLIARQWNIAEATVKVHVKAILRKIKVKNRTEAACWAWNNGLRTDSSPVASRWMDNSDYEKAHSIDTYEESIGPYKASRMPTNGPRQSPRAESRQVQAENDHFK